MHGEFASLAHSSTSAGAHMYASSSLTPGWRFNNKLLPYGEAASSTSCSLDSWHLSPCCSPSPVLQLRQLLFSLQRTPLHVASFQCVHIVGVHLYVNDIFMVLFGEGMSPVFYPYGLDCAIHDQQPDQLLLAMQSVQALLVSSSSWCITWTGIHLGSS